MGWDEQDGDPMVYNALYISACAHMVYPYAPLDGRAYRYMDIHVCTCHIMVFGGLETSKYGSKRVQIWDPQI